MVQHMHIELWAKYYKLLLLLFLYTQLNQMIIIGSSSKNKAIHVLKFLRFTNPNFN